MDKTPREAQAAALRRLEIENLSAEYRRVFRIGPSVKKGFHVENLQTRCRALASREKK